MSSTVGQRLVRSLYGRELPPPGGITHVAAVWATPAGGYQVLAIGPGAPTSDADRLALAIARARADAIVTTGSILRGEPASAHELHPDSRTRSALLRWRRDHLGRAEPPISAILTRGVQLPREHPVLRRGRVWFLAPEAAAAAIETPPGGRVFGRAAPGLRDTLRVLREEGCESILVEAGPSTAWDLYEDPPLVDTLLLSVFEADHLPADRCAGAFVSPGRVQRLFGPPRHEHVAEEESGRWHLRLYVRDPE